MLPSLVTSSREIRLIGRWFTGVGNVHGLPTREQKAHNDEPAIKRYIQHPATQRLVGLG
jgi:hypothetical protein